MLKTTKNSNVFLLKQEVSLLQQFLLSIYQNLGLEEILNILARGIEKILGFNTVLISIFNKNENLFERKAHAGIPEATFEELKKQKVPYSEIQMLLKDEFKIMNSYYIPHYYFNENKKLSKFIRRFGKKIESRNSKSTSEKRQWHPEDVFLTPIKTNDGKFLGIVSVDNPIHNQIPSRNTISLMETFSTYAAVAIEKNRILKQETETLKRMNAILNISKLIGQIFDLKTLYKETIHNIRSTFGYTNISIFEMNPSGRLILKAYSGYEDFNLKKASKDLTKKGLVGKALKMRKPLLIQNVQEEPLYIGDKSKPKSEVIIPLIVKDKIIGVIDAESKGKFSLGKEDLQTIKLLGEYIAIFIENARLYRKARDLAVKDEMTGTFNYRFFREEVRKKIDRMKKKDAYFTLLMVDIDNFKLLNDTFGHLQGDKVLKEVSKIIKRHIRKKDVLTRYGGDEFVIVLWEIKKEKARLLAERIRKAVKQEFKGFNFNLTLSIGIASFPEDGRRVGTLLDRVDKALYRAKAKGRDRISA